MLLKLLARTTGIAVCFLLSVVESAECSNTQMDVNSTADAEALVEALDCTGGGVFKVAWHGSVATNQTFHVTEGVSLTITGKQTSMSALDGHEGKATIAGDNITSQSGIFSISAASTLTLDNLVVQGGKPAIDYGGGAVDAQGSADANTTVNVIDCLFTHNTGNSSGARGRPYYIRLSRATDVLPLYCRATAPPSPPLPPLYRFEVSARLWLFLNCKPTRLLPPTY